MSCQDYLMSKDCVAYAYEPTPFHSPMETEPAFWEQSDDPFAPGPIRQLSQTHTYWQPHQATLSIRSSPHQRPTHSHRRIQKKQCSYDLHEDFIHDARTEQSGSNDGAGSVSDVPSSPLSYSTSSSDSSGPTEFSFGSEIQRCPSGGGSEDCTVSTNAHSIPRSLPRSVPKGQNMLAIVSKKNLSWPLLRVKSTSKPAQ